ncbi:hypothetical protein [Bradyrhizobium sp. BR 1432]|uniref:hypothetical protein n=1 Tax=Bradyrhizobium sp. BR 1432 TaxID=3447966 RepID=UPI003EE4A5C8
MKLVGANLLATSSARFSQHSSAIFWESITAQAAADAGIPAGIHPEPLDLSGELANRGAQLKALIDGVNVVVGVLNGTVQEANTQFWLDVKATHGIDTENYLWSLDNGTLVPTPKPAAGSPTGRLPRGMKHRPRVGRPFSSISQTFVDAPA